MKFHGTCYLTVGALTFLAFASVADAATRTVQFAGLASAGNAGDTVEVQTRNSLDAITCQVVVVNTGTQDEKITAVEPIGISTNDRSLGTRSIHQCLLLSGNAECEAGGCIGKVLPKGGMCLIGYTAGMSMRGEALFGGVCAGKIQVQDVDNAKPGSVVASGAIGVNQETKVLGGVLSGAYYASGAHVTKDSPDLMEWFKAGINDKVSSMQMNVYCDVACTAKAGVTAVNTAADLKKVEYCKRHCGSAVLSGMDCSANYTKACANDCFWFNKTGGVETPTGFKCNSQSCFYQDLQAVYCQAVAAGTTDRLLSGEVTGTVRMSGSVNSGGSIKGDCKQSISGNKTGTCHCDTLDVGVKLLPSANWNWASCQCKDTSGSVIAQPVDDANGTWVPATGPKVGAKCEALNGTDLLIDLANQQQVSNFNTGLTCGWSYVPNSALVTMNSCNFNDTESGGINLNGNLNPGNVAPANAHFAGGMVYELEIGPISSICSANKEFAMMGGAMPTHGGSLSDDASIYEVNGKYPPEALYCAHRHGNKDLFMRTGSTVSFPINGGMPF